MHVIKEHVRVGASSSWEPTYRQQRLEFETRTFGLRVKHPAPWTWSHHSRPRVPRWDFLMLWPTCDFWHRNHQIFFNIVIAKKWQSPCLQNILAIKLNTVCIYVVWSFCGPCCYPLMTLEPRFRKPLPSTIPPESPLRRWRSGCLSSSLRGSAPCSGCSWAGPGSRGASGPGGPPGGSEGGRTSGRPTWRSPDPPSHWASAAPPPCSPWMERGGGGEWWGYSLNLNLWDCRWRTGQRSCMWWFF